MKIVRYYGAMRCINWCIMGRNEHTNSRTANIDETLPFLLNTRDA